MEFLYTGDAVSFSRVVVGRLPLAAAAAAVVDARWMAAAVFIGDENDPGAGEGATAKLCW